jgi:hypothetical protein
MIAPSDIDLPRPRGRPQAKDRAALDHATRLILRVKPNPDPAPQGLPRSRDEIAPGHLVIARETLEMGWWEAIVVERTGDLVTVRYRNYPQYPNMVRHRSAIALISPAAQ